MKLPDTMSADDFQRMLQNKEINIRGNKIKRTDFQKEHIESKSEAIKARPKKKFKPYSKPLSKAKPSDDTTIEFDMSFVTLNDYVNAERTNRHMAANIKKQQTNGVCFIAQSKRFKLEEGRYNVTFIWHKPNNMNDHDNISFAQKFILDGVVKAGSIPEDNPKHINELHHGFVLDKSKDYIWCEVEFEKVL